MRLAILNSSIFTEVDAKLIQEKIDLERTQEIEHRKESGDKTFEQNTYVLRAEIKSTIELQMI